MVAVAATEKVECVFNVQQQMLQKLDSTEGCIQNISYVLGLQLDMEITSIVPAHLPSTPGAELRGSTSLPPSTSTPGPVTSADTSIPPTAPPTELRTPASNATPQDGASTDLPTVRQSKEETLIPPSEVVAKYPRMRGDCRMGEVAVKLAQEYFFGNDLMRQSTVLGFKEFPALPEDGVQALKQTILSVCPDYHCNPHGFEGLWKRCVDAFNHTCSKLRKY